MFTPGTITMPIRIAVMHGSDVLYSQLHQYQIQVTDPSTASQFVFTDSNVVVPEPTAKDYQAYAGYDDTAPARRTRSPARKRSALRRRTRRCLGVVAALATVCQLFERSNMIWS